MGALERRCGLEEGYCDEGGAHHRFPRLRRVGDDVCALLAVPLGEVSSVYSLYARRAAALFAAMDSDRCGRPFDESLSAASSRTRSTECGFAKAKVGKQAIAASRPVTRTELVRAGDECSLLATPSFVGGLCTGCAVSHFHPALSGAQRRRSGRSQALNHRICPPCSRA